MNLVPDLARWHGSGSQDLDMDIWVQQGPDRELRALAGSGLGALCENS